MQQIISTKTGAKIKLEYNESIIDKIKITYIPSPSEHGKEIVKTVSITKKEG